MGSFAFHLLFIHVIVTPPRVWENYAIGVFSCNDWFVKALVSSLWMKMLSFWYLWKKILQGFLFEIERWRNLCVFYDIFSIINSIFSFLAEMEDTFVFSRKKMVKKNSLFCRFLGSIIMGFQYGVSLCL